MVTIVATIRNCRNAITVLLKKKVPYSLLGEVRTETCGTLYIKDFDIMLNCFDYFYLRLLEGNV